MRRIINTAILAVSGLIAAAGSASAQDATTTQTVGFEVEAFRIIDVSADPGTLVIGEGSDWTATEASTTWSLATNEEALKVTGEIDGAMPDGLTLTVDLVAPTDATSTGETTLSLTAADLVTGISQVDEDGLGVTYGLEAEPTAGAVAPDTRTVTFTLTEGA